MMMNLDARLTISTGTTVNVELDPQGKSKVQLHSSGTVNYTTDYMKAALLEVKRFLTYHRH